MTEKNRGSQIHEGDSGHGQKPAGQPADDAARERRDEALRNLAEREEADLREPR
jgi:hypothetical protein